MSAKEKVYVYSYYIITMLIYTRTHISYVIGKNLPPLKFRMFSSLTILILDLVLIKMVFYDGKISCLNFVYIAHALRLLPAGCICTLRFL